MQNAATITPACGETATAVPVVSLRELLPWTLFLGLFLLQAYVVAAVPDHGLHELLHDGRHLLGFPCH